MMKALLLLTLVAVAYGQGRKVPVDAQREGSQYHFAWLYDGNRSYGWNGANGYCSSLGRGWNGVSIETNGESTFINDIISGARLPWIWTGGRRKGRDFAWPSGKPFVGLNWSHTGLIGKRQNLTTVNQEARTAWLSSTTSTRTASSGTMLGAVTRSPLSARSQTEHQGSERVNE
ncbi:uncharacterized protein LOC119591308 [Penaeus monodon]|uniref:uncharacterized protein LOC119591308 n=1 Tax=Penaeus monodon TaxID=6687 RepID=UPI0018A6FE32|nr:uncharacterized protein LOC119591308 [Penaeus monodon]